MLRLGRSSSHFLSPISAEFQFSSSSWFNKWPISRLILWMFFYWYCYIVFKIVNFIVNSTLQSPRWQQVLPRGVSFYLVYQTATFNSATGTNLAHQTATVNSATDAVISDCDVIFRYWSILIIRLRRSIPLLMQFIIFHYLKWCRFWSDAASAVFKHEAQDRVFATPVSIIFHYLKWCRWWCLVKRRAGSLQHLRRLCSTIEGDVAVVAKGRSADLHPCRDFSPESRKRNQWQYFRFKTIFNQQPTPVDSD